MPKGITAVSYAGYVVYGNCLTGNILTYNNKS